MMQQWQRQHNGWWVGLILILVLAGCAAPGAAPTPQPAGPPTAGTPLDPPREVADFTLTSQAGEPLSLSDLEGRLVLLYFGYTFCPDICPTTLAELVYVRRNLGDQADEVQVVFVSVDGERDTPEVLRHYLGAFDESFLGLTGEEMEIRKIGADYGLYFEKREVEGTSADYLVDHTAASFLIDRQRRLRMIYGYGTPADVISSDIQRLLEEEGRAP